MPSYQVGEDVFYSMSFAEGWSDALDWPSTGDYFTVKYHYLYTRNIFFATDYRVGFESCLSRRGIKIIQG